MQPDIDPTTGLPPAGAARQEELSIRHDNLQQAAEEKAAVLEHHTVANPNVLAPERELQHLIRIKDALSVSNPQPGWAYSWVFTGLQGQMMRLALNGTD